MTLLIFGKTGQVAMELGRQAAPQEAVFLDRAAADLTDPDACARAIHAHSPRAVLNAAAYTNVDGAETHETLATTINAAAPAAMAGACADLDIPFLHLSTDYVFDGTATRPWQPGDAVAPLNAYGRSKWAGEQAIRASTARHIILRTAWVFSAHGGNFVKTMLRLGAERAHLNVVADQHGSPTAAADIASALLRLSQTLQEGATGKPMGKTGGKTGGGTYHYGGTPATTWAGFARAIMAEAALPCQIHDIPASAYPTPATRPAFSVLDGTTLRRDFNISAPDWRPALRAVLTELGHRP